MRQVLTIFFAFALAALFAAPWSAAQNAGVVQPGASLKLLADGFSFTEGPAADAQGNVFFTDQPNDKIHKWHVDGKLSVFSDKTGRANGMFFDKQGNLYTASDLNNEIWMFNPSGKATIVLNGYEGKRFNGPNDIWIHPNGGLYFTDPFYKRDYWKHTSMEQDGQHLYYLTPDRKKVVRVANDIQQPNGLIGTPDGKRLYVADIRGREILVYDINPDGTLSNKKVFTKMGADGMTMDEHENIYLCGKGVTVFNVKGEQIDHIEVPKGWTANATFGGKDRNILFITAMDSVYAIQMRVRGAY